MRYRKAKCIQARIKGRCEGKKNVSLFIKKKKKRKRKKREVVRVRCRRSWLIRKK